MSVVMGIDCKLYYLSTGSRATWGTITNGIASGAAPASLTEITPVKDVDITLSKSMGDLTSRRSKFKKSKSAVKEVGIEFEILWDPADATFEALRSAFFGDDTIAVAALDGDKATVGSSGLWADFEVETFDRSEGLENAVTAKVKLVPGDSAVEPEWVEVSA
jgi:hypothetical protein